MTWIHDRLYAAGGEHLPQTWASFADQTGVRAVLHLRPGRPARFIGPPPEAFLWLAVEDENQAGGEERLLASHFLTDCLAQGWQVVLHSSLGRHRTRWAYVAFEVYNGLPVKAALRKAAERPWLSPYHTDEASWSDFAQVVRDAGAEARGERRPTP